MWFLVFVYNYIKFPTYRHEYDTHSLMNSHCHQPDAVNAAVFFLIHQSFDVFYGLIESARLRRQENARVSLSNASPWLPEHVRREALRVRFEADVPQGVREMSAQLCVNENNQTKREITVNKNMTCRCSRTTVKEASWTRPNVSNKDIWRHSGRLWYIILHSTLPNCQPQAFSPHLISSFPFVSLFQLQAGELKTIMSSYRGLLTVLL